MAKNYAAGTPMGNNAMPLYNSPAPFKAIAQYLGENATTSSVVTLTQNTTAIEVAAQSAPVAIRWVYQADGTGAATSVIAQATGSNFDHVVPANTVRRFVVPIEVSANQGYSSMQGTNRLEGLFQRIAYKTQGIASVAVTEYGSSNSY